MLNINTILIIDAEKDTVRLTKTHLEKEGFKVTACSNGIDAIELFHSINPSLVILDLTLPDISGQAVCKKIRMYSEVPIIIATAVADEESILEGFNIGADDYVTKPFSQRQLAARVDALLRRTRNADNFTSKNFSFYDGDLTINIDKSEVRKNGELINLTQTEFNLLLTMLKHPYKAFSREMLIESVYGIDYAGCDRVIDTHIKNLRRKIESDLKKPKYIVTARGIGYRFGID